MRYALPAATLIIGIAIGAALSVQSPLSDHLTCAREYAPDVAAIERCRASVAIGRKAEAMREQAFQEYRAARGL